jgi:DNA-binding transcriptional MerR regulator
LSFVRRARDLGFSIEQIWALLGLSDQRDRSCSIVDAIAREHLDEVDRKISDLKKLRRELGTLINPCDHGTIADCRIIEAIVRRPHSWPWACLLKRRSLGDVANL